MVLDRHKIKKFRPRIRLCIARNKTLVWSMDDFPSVAKLFSLVQYDDLNFYCNDHYIVSNYMFFGFQSLCNKTIVIPMSSSSSSLLLVSSENYFRKKSARSRYSTYLNDWPRQVDIWKKYISRWFRWEDSHTNCPDSEKVKSNLESFV